jgi:hypothetical protein
MPCETDVAIRFEKHYRPEGQGKGYTATYVLKRSQDVTLTAVAHGNSSREPHRFFDSAGTAAFSVRPTRAFANATFEVCKGETGELLGRILQMTASGSFWSIENARGGVIASVRSPGPLSEKIVTQALGGSRSIYEFRADDRLLAHMTEERRTQKPTSGFKGFIEKLIPTADWVLRLDPAVDLDQRLLLAAALLVQEITVRHDRA